MKTRSQPKPQRNPSKNARVPARIVVENVNTPGKSRALDAAIASQHVE